MLLTLVAVTTDKCGAGMSLCGTSWRGSMVGTIEITDLLKECASETLMGVIFFSAYNTAVTSG